MHVSVFFFPVSSFSCIYYSLLSFSFSDLKFPFFLANWVGISGHHLVSWFVPEFKENCSLQWPTEITPVFYSVWGCERDVESMPSCCITFQQQLAWNLECCFLSKLVHKANQGGALEQLVQKDIIFCKLQPTLLHTVNGLAESKGTK